MTSLQFRRDLELLKEARRVLDDPIVKLMLEITTDERPSRRGAVVPADMIGVQLGRTYGYEESLDAFRNLARPVAEAPPQPQMTWNAQKED